MVWCISIMMVVRVVFCSRRTCERRSDNTFVMIVELNGEWNCVKMKRKRK